MESRGRCNGRMGLHSRMAAVLAGEAVCVTRLLIAMVCALMLPACAPVQTAQLFVGPGGGTSTCSKGSGWMLGLTGMAIDSNNYSNCCSTLWAAGFLEIERAGAVGLILRDDPECGHPTVVRVVESSPAGAAGVAPGDVIVTVGDREVGTVASAQRLLFGIAWTSVTVRFLRDASDTTITLTRGEHLRVFGRWPPSDGA